MKKRKILLIILIVLLVIIGIVVFGAVNKKILKPQKAGNIAKEYGLEVDKIKYSTYNTDMLEIYCSNLWALEWDCVMNMDKEISSIRGLGGVLYYLDYDNYYNVTPEDNEIYMVSESRRIYYEGSWSNYKIEKKESNSSPSSSGTKYISGKTCGICGSKATQEINDEYYCNTHFKNAVGYYMNLD